MCPRLAPPAPADPHAPEFFVGRTQTASALAFNLSCMVRCALTVWTSISSCGPHARHVRQAWDRRGALGRRGLTHQVHSWGLIRAGLLRRIGPCEEERGRDAQEAAPKPRHGGDGVRRGAQPPPPGHQEGPQGLPDEGLQLQLQRAAFYSIPFRSCDAGCVSLTSD